jgi:hypothetical protein
LHREILASVDLDILSNIRIASALHNGAWEDKATADIGVPTDEDDDGGEAETTKLNPPITPTADTGTLLDEHYGTSEANEAQAESAAAPGNDGRANEASPVAAPEASNDGDTERSGDGAAPLVTSNSTESGDTAKNQEQIDRDAFNAESPHYADHLTLWSAYDRNSRKRGTTGKVLDSNNHLHALYIAQAYVNIHDGRRAGSAQWILIKASEEKKLFKEPTCEETYRFGSWVVDHSWRKIKRRKAPAPPISEEEAQCRADEVKAYRKDFMDEMEGENAEYKRERLKEATEMSVRLVQGFIAAV